MEIPLHLRRALVPARGVFAFFSPVLYDIYLSLIDAAERYIAIIHPWKMIEMGNPFSSPAARVTYTYNTNAA